MASYSVSLLEKKEIARNTWAFAFEKPSTFSFSPGQFTTMIVQIDKGRTDSRDMTIASSPLDETICIVTKIPEQRSTFKHALVSLPVGGSVSLTKPAGGFVLRSETPHVFLAGGIGITPFYSMLKFASQKEMEIPLSLFVSFSSKEDMIFYSDLKSLQTRNTSIVYSLTNSCAGWEDETGRISEKMIRKYVQDIKSQTFMIAGPVAMVDDTNKMLLEMGVLAESIKIDYFTGY